MPGGSKRERKSRLDKGQRGAAEFTGFAAFATNTATASSTAAAHVSASAAAKPKAASEASTTSKPSSTSSKKAPKKGGGTNELRPSPLYIGSDSNLTLIFRKIGQKRDAITKTRALAELSTYAFPPLENTTTDTNATTPTRQEQIQALSHLIFLYTTKLHYDNNPSVRSEVLNVLYHAKSHVPKAWKVLVGTGGSSSGSEVVGMVWCATVDPMLDVRKSATRLMTTIIDSCSADAEDNNENENVGTIISSAVCAHVETILNYGRAGALHDALFSVKRRGTDAASAAGGKKEKKAMKKAQSTDSSSTTTSESEKEEMEERYERVLLCALDGLSRLVTLYPEKDEEEEKKLPGKSETTNGKIKFLYANSIVDGNVIWKHMTTSRGSFRRATYSLVASLCQHGKSLIYSHTKKLSTLIPSVLSSEKDPANFPSLIEMVLLYIASFQKQKQQSHNIITAWDSMDKATFTKSICKVLKKGCYGSSAVQWGPTMLPLVATLPQSDGKLHNQFLSALWEGHKVAIGAADTSAIIAAVAECVSFLLLRRIRSSGDDVGESKDAEIIGDTAENGSGNDKVEMTKETAQYFIDALSYYLETPKFLPKASNELLDCLARDLHKLDMASYNRDDCAMADGKQWFWEEGIPSVMTVDDSSGEVLRRMSKLLRNIMDCATSQSEKKSQSEADANQNTANKQKAPSHLLPICKKNFDHLLEKSRSINSKTMKQDETALFLSIILFGDFDYLFAGHESKEDHVDTANNVEFFCVNDLLQWIISRKSVSSSVLKTDFQILKSCLCALPATSHRKLVWESILKEMITAQCDLKNIALGMSMLADIMCVDTDGNKKSESIVQCPSLDNLAVKVGNNAIKHSYHLIAIHHSHMSDDSDTDDEQAACLSSESVFIKSCVGLEQNGPMLISEEVIKKWIEAACPSNQQDKVEVAGNLLNEDRTGINVLLEVLLRLALYPTPIINDHEKVELSLESWRQGGPIWVSKGSELATDPLIFDEFRLCASTSLKEDIKTEVEDSALIDLTSHSWSERAWRLHELCERVNETPAHSTMTLVGLDSVDLWKSCIEADNVKRSEYLFLCLMYLLHNIDRDEIRRELFLGQIQSLSASAEFLIHVLVTLIDTNQYTPRSIARRVSRLEELLAILGGKNGLSPELIEACCREIVHYLSLHMRIISDGSKKVDNFPELSRGVSVLDFLLGILFGKFQPVKNKNREVDEKTSKDDVNANDIKEGDILWYVKDRSSLDETRIRVKVVKVHTDDFPNLYFTIREEGAGVYDDGGTAERQTVSDRLRCQEIPVQNDTSPERNAGMTEETDQARQKMEELILKHLVQAQLTTCLSKGKSNMISEVAAECANVAISRCGLTGKAGVGSVRYDTFQIVSSLEKFICDQVVKRELGNETTSALRCLTSTMGFGLLTEPSANNFAILRFTPDNSIEMILRLYEDTEWLGEIPHDEDKLVFHSTVLTWVCIAITTVQEGTVFRRVMNVLKYIGATLLSEGRSKYDVLMQNSLTFAEAVSAVQKVAHQCIDYSSESVAEKEVLSTLIMCFTSVWRGDGDVKVSDDYLDTTSHNPAWLDSFVSILRHNYEENQENLLLGAKVFAEDLITLLSSMSKRWCALQILSVLAKKGGQLYTEDKVVLSDETCRRLKSWKSPLEEEESEELDEDVLLTASWLPQRLMVEVESWGESLEVHEGPMERTGMGRLLAWLIFIDFLESAALADMRNKVAISSYVENTGALKEILGLALRHADMNNKKDDTWKSCISFSNDNINGYDLSASKISTLVIFRTVEVLPTLVKKWWSDDCPRSLQSQVSSFVENCVAPDILQRELARIDSDSGFGDMKVSGSCVSREVVATYIQDECQLSVMIKIPPSFPLRNVEVDCQKTLGIAEKRWRHWALQIMLMLNSQDGSVMDALLLWKQNVDKEFEGVEPCPVCYSVLCVKTHAMPKLECKTCHNRFHASCLYKWFHSSGKSQCVLCQQPWSGTKI